MGLSVLKISWNYRNLLGFCLASKKLIKEMKKRNP